jgi:hypothetical protein
MLRCILCGAPFTSEIEDPADGERHDTLTCAAHSDEQLRRRGLDELWGGEDRETSPAFFTGRQARIVGAWDHPPCIATYALLDDGDLLMFVTWGLSLVLVARVPRGERVLAEPEGFPPCRREPWPTAIREGWILDTVRPLPDGRVQAEFPGWGELVFAADLASWRELGDGRYFLIEDWRPVGAVSGV